MVWTLTGREPRFPVIRRILNWSVLIGGVGVGLYFGWPWIEGTVLPWLSDLLAGMGGGEEAAK